MNITNLDEYHIIIPLDCSATLCNHIITIQKGDTERKKIYSWYH